MFLAILISAAGTHRHIPTLRMPAKRNLTLGQITREMISTVSNRSFLSLLLSGIATAMAAGLGASLNNYFNTYFWEFSAVQISYLTAGVYLSAIAALIGAPLLARRFGKRTTAICLFILSVAIGIGPLLLRVGGMFPPNHSLALLATIFCTSIVGTAFGIGSATMVSSMIADVVDASELATGRRSEGLFFAAAAFVNKAVSGFGILGATIVIQLIHLPAGAQPGKVPVEIVRNLALVYCPIMVGLYATALILLLGYRITRKSHEETLAQLAAEAEETLHHPPIEAPTTP
jgi:Na+/melibiose symporter-like transporter